MKITKTFLALGVLYLASCASVKLAAPTQADVSRMQSKYPNYTLAQLTEGQAIFEQNCNKCHGLKNPAKYSEEDLNKIVPRMVKKVNKKGEVITAEKQETLLRYLITMSSASKN